MPQTRYRDLTGTRSGRLLVVYDAGRSKEGAVIWFCLCTCGGNTTVRSQSLAFGGSKSCGCLQKDTGKKVSQLNLKHGMSGTKEHAAWMRMVSRCTDPKSKDYVYYGARGVTVCQQWLDSFSSFYNDLGPRPEGNFELDRKDPAGNYEPGNCQWIPRWSGKQRPHKNRRPHADS